MMEKNMKKNIYIWYMKHFAIHQKLTQHCNSAILQLKKRERMFRKIRTQRKL